MSGILLISVMYLINEFQFIDCENCETEANKGKFQNSAIGKLKVNSFEKKGLFTQTISV